MSVLVSGLFAWIISGAVASVDQFGDHVPPKPPSIWVLTAYFGVGARFVKTPVAAVLRACCLVIALA